MKIRTNHSGSGNYLSSFIHADTGEAEMLVYITALATSGKLELNVKLKDPRVVLVVEDESERVEEGVA
jgi:hypothetical protein